MGTNLARGGGRLLAPERSYGRYKLLILYSTGVNELITQNVIIISWHKVLFQHPRMNIFKKKIYLYSLDLLITSASYSVISAHW